jgi:hypothetical protein
MSIRVVGPVRNLCGQRRYSRRLTQPSYSQAPTQQKYSAKINSIALEGMPMNKLSITLLALTCAVFVAAQDNTPKASAVSRRYHAFRLQNTEPSYSLKKVKAIVAQIKPSDDGYILADAKFKALTVPEKFTFTMIHGEDMDQNCDPEQDIVGEEHQIFGDLPGNFDYTAMWSDRQLKFLKNNRKAVIGMLRSTMRSHKHVGLNIKHAIVELDANELIPDLVTSFNKDKRDLDLLTTMLLLMKDGKFKPLLDSATYKKCYGPNADYKSSVEGNPGNQKLTVQRAEAFYRSRMG